MKTSHACFASAVLLASVVAAQTAPFDFVNETSTRIVPHPAAAMFYRMPGLGRIGTPDESEADVDHGDLNGDGRDDIVIARKAPQYLCGQRIAVLLVNENGKLVDRTPDSARDFFLHPRNARDVKIRDFDGDGFPEVLIGCTFGEDPELYRNLGLVPNGLWRGLARAVSWLRTEQGNTSFTQDTPPLGFQPGMTTCAVDCADIDNDGDLDIYVGNYPTTAEACGGSSLPFESRDRILVNDGTGHFTEESTNRLAVDSNSGITTGIDFADADGDNDQDFFITKALAGYEVQFNNGSGVFTMKQGVPGAISHYMHVPVDLDGDTLPDSYGVGDLADRSAINLGVGVGGMLNWGPPVPPVSSLVTSLGGNAKAYDFDGDSTPDVGVCDLDTITASIPSACFDGWTFTLLRGRYVAPSVPHLYDPFEGNWQSWHVDGSWDFAGPDVDGDGKPDIVMLTCAGVLVLINTSP